jgi:DNA polymerase-3 subunit epsilon
MQTNDENLIVTDQPAIAAIPRLIVLDLEATGLNMDFDRIIELGVVEMQMGRQVLEHSRQFRGGMTFGSSRIHGISDTEREQEPTFEDAAADVARYLSDAWLAGHNIKRFDHPMIVSKLRAAHQGLSGVKLIDTLTLAKRLGVMGKSLKALCQRYNIVHGGHRGLNDARCTLQLLIVLATNLGATKPEDLLVK